MEISELAPLVLIDCKNVKKHLTNDQIDNQKTNEIMQEVIDPLSIEDLKEKKTLNGIKADIQDRAANKSGRFPCRYCNQTFSKNIYAMSHEKKSCKKTKSNQTKTKIKEKVFDTFIDQTTNKIKAEVFDPLLDHTENQIKYENSTNKTEEILSHENGRFPCRKCNKTFNLKIKARRHENRSCKGIRSNHQSEIIIANESGRFPCSHCNQTFKLKKLVRRHQRKSCKGELTNKIISEEKIPNENGRFPCQNCNLTFKNKSHARRHEKNSCKNRPNLFFNGSLDTCNKSTNPKDQTEDQTEDLSEDQEVMVPLMDQNEDLKEYKTLYETKEGVTWDDTEKNATNEIEDRIANKKGRFPCKYCNQTFSKIKYVMSHEKKSCKRKSKQATNKIMKEIFDPFMDQTELERSINKKEEIITNREGSFPCRKCDKTFSLKIHARRHEKRSCKGISSNYQNVKIIVNENGRFSCSYCNKTYSLKEHVRRHVKNSCKNRPNLFFNRSLDTCNKLANPQDQTEDQTEDQIGDQYSNDQEEIICQPDLSISSNHQNEEIIFNESESGKFPCSNCNKTFSYKENVTRHKKKSCKGEFAYQSENIVADENGRFPCRNCNQTFSFKNDVRRHQNISCKNRHKHSFIDTTDKLAKLPKSTSVIKIEPQAETGEDLLSLESGRFQCRNCNQTRSSKSLLRRHEKKSCKGTRNIHKNEKTIFNEIRRKKSCKKSYNDYLDTYERFPNPPKSSNIINRAWRSN